MKLVLKIILCLVINGLIIKSLFINSIDKYSGKSVLIKQVYSKPGYKYWSTVDGKDFCKAMPEEDFKALYLRLESYSNTKTNVVYFQNVDLLECSDYIKQIAEQFHKYNLEIAFNLETKIEREKVFNADFTVINENYFKDKFQKTVFINDWVDYIVFDDAMQFMTFDERRHSQVLLRDIFPKPYLGFRFTKAENSNPDSTHAIRSDKTMKEFLPRDDDGDFIITSISYPKLKRTMIFIEDLSLDRIGADGEFLK